MLEEALTLHQNNRLDEAAALYRKILSGDAHNADALHLLGVTEFQKKNPVVAIELIIRAINIQPNKAVFYANLGLALQAVARLDEALASYDRALAINPHYAEALNHRGNVLRDLKRFDDALASFARAIALKPDYADALNHRGTVLNEMKRFDAALASYDRALVVKPHYPEALNNRGNTLQSLNRFDEALDCYDRALTMAPNNAEILNNRGNALSALKRADEAVADYSRALDISPGNPEILNNRGAALMDMKAFDDAIHSFDAALAIRPDYAEALNSRGAAFNELGRFGDALSNFDAALSLKPDYAEAFYNRGNALSALKRYEDACLSYDRALAIKPGYDYLPGWRLLCKMKICDWAGIDEEFAHIIAKAAAGEKTATPSALLAMPASAALQRNCAEQFIRDNYPPISLLLPLPVYRGHDRIRLGYFSADFHEHATAYLMAELFERHDRSRFELFAFSFGPNSQGAMRARLEKSFDRFIECGTLSDKDIALLARRFEIDIAIDLKGFTEGSRPNIFAMRAAPLQAGYLGYPGTMGAGYVDYFIADSTIIPAAHRQHYSEKIVCLPGSYQVNDSKRLVADTAFTRTECGLPEQGFVFCCFNNSYKIAPDIFEIWMRLLKAVKGSVLWLLKDNHSAAQNLRTEASSRGVAPERLVFAERLEMSTHLARHRLADLFLDTLPYNAHTTASDALWAGLPILTCLTDAFPGRVGASLLHAMDMPELITENLGAYEALAQNLATDPARMQRLRRILASSRSTASLFNAPAFTRHIEAAYTVMWQRHQAGLAPEHISVTPQAEPASAKS